MPLEEIDFECIPWPIRQEHEVAGTRGSRGAAAGLASEAVASGASAGRAVFRDASQALCHECNLIRSLLPRNTGCWLVSSQAVCPWKVVRSQPEVKDEFLSVNI